MRILIVAIFLMCAGFGYSQTIVSDPNTLDVGEEYVSIDFTLTITADEYTCMQYQEYTFDQVLGRVGVLQYFESMEIYVRRLISQLADLAELMELAE